MKTAKPDFIDGVVVGLVWGIFIMLVFVAFVIMIV